MLLVERLSNRACQRLARWVDAIPILWPEQRRRGGFYLDDRQVIRKSVSKQKICNLLSFARVMDLTAELHTDDCATSVIGIAQQVGFI